MKREESNVRVPECAWDALMDIAAERGVSRDEAVRQLLDEHVSLQEQRDPEDRRTHISTVLRYPPVRRHRMQPRLGRQLRLRLAPGMAERARAVSLRLPGQSHRAHRHYQARLLTDAVVTAIAEARPFTDDFLDGLLPILRHGSALGLWLLAAASTSSAPENAVLDAAERARDSDRSVSRTRLLLVAEALDDAAAWHAPERFAAATAIARRWLRGPTASACERFLYDRRAAWEQVRRALRRSADRGWLREGIPAWFDWAGRGGAAVWRAQRRVELQDFEDWLIDRSGVPEERRVWPPGWIVRIPSDWHACVVVAERIPEPFTTWILTRRVLAFPAQGGQAIWPLKPVTGRAGWTVALAMEPVIAAGAGLRPDKISGFIESVLLDWQSEDTEHREIVGRLDVPAGKARDFGLITADEHRKIMAQARAATLQKMAAIVDGLHEHQRHRRDELRAAAALGNARQFALLAGDLGVDFGIVQATWRWPLRSVAQEALAGTHAGAVEWLAGWVYRVCTRMLHKASEQAWHAGFDHHPASYWTRESSM